jgi:hypothetical protein
LPQISTEFDDDRNDYVASRNTGGIIARHYRYAVSPGTIEYDFEQTRPCPVMWDGDVDVATVDGEGRVAMRRLAMAMGWTSGQPLALTVSDGIVRVTAPAHPAASYAIAVIMDTRWRVLLPYGLRQHCGWAPGTRLIIVAAPKAGIVAALPLAQVVAPLVRS